MTASSEGDRFIERPEDKRRDVSPAVQAIVSVPPLGDLLSKVMPGARSGRLDGDFDLHEDRDDRDHSVVASRWARGA